MKPMLTIVTLLLLAGVCACAELFPTSTAPEGRAPAPSENELVRQPGAYLLWLRCPLHQEWNGTACTGEMTKYNQDHALMACPVGFRVPTRDELINLLDDCNDRVVRGSYGTCNSCKDSAACSQMFDAQEGYYWSSDIINELEAWAASLVQGHVASGPTPSPKPVLCVQSVSE